MVINLTGKTVLVTGGSGAIGYAICKKYAEAGANVIIVDLSGIHAAAQIRELEESGIKAAFIRANVTSRPDMENAFAQAAQQFGKIDILINNAGYNTPPNIRHLIHDFDDDEWHKAIDICLNGTYNTTKPFIQQAIETNGGGRIVNIASVCGHVPLRLQCAYDAAKAAIINLTKSMALELAPHDILVNAITPGSVLNAGLRQHFYSDNALAQRILANVALKRPGEPEEMAGAAVFLGSDEISYMTGNVLIIDGGWIAGDRVWDALA